MKESYLFDMAFNNVVFKGRNISYGAYKLREIYNRHVLIAALVATSVFSGALTIPVVNNMFSETVDPASKPQEQDGCFMLEDIVILPPPRPELVKAEKAADLPKQEKVITKKYVAPKVVKNNINTPEDVPDQRDLGNTVISTKTVDGLLPETPTINAVPELPKGISGGEEENTEPYLSVEEMPMFGKKESDLMAYLGRKIRYPAKARNAGIEGLVILSFVVTAQGEVKDVKVLKGLGYGTEEEAIRVVEEMPKWKPGKQNGGTVPVQYTLPIRLQIQN